MFFQKSILVGFIGLLTLSSCATIPKEAVQLSYTVGQDIQELHGGYRRTVVFSFEQIRQRGLTVIDTKWTPAYLKDYVKGSELLDHLRDESIPESERYADLEYWARGAIEDIDNKRKAFLEPLKKREKALLSNVDDAFGRVIRANAAVTAHLNSVLKVQKLQDEILDSFGLKGVRDSINNAVIEASDFAAKATTEIEDAARQLEGAN